MSWPSGDAAEPEKVVSCRSFDSEAAAAKPRTASGASSRPAPCEVAAGVASPACPSTCATRGTASATTA
jgi:hypothetical protein